MYATYAQKLNYEQDKLHVTQQLPRYRFFLLDL